MWEIKAFFKMLWIGNIKKNFSETRTVKNFPSSYIAGKLDVSLYL